MKKLCKKGQVHPSPPSISDHLAVLPATILTLTAALSAEDKEVLAYLIIISSSINTSTSSNFSRHDPEAVIPRSTHGTDQGSTDYHSGTWGDHTPMFECNCFRCYMSFWARWDASPSHELIHEIIEAYEDDQLVKKKKKRRSAKMKKAERKKIASDELKGTGDQEGSGNRSAISRDEVGESVSVDASGSTTDGVKVTGDHVEVGWVGIRGCVRKIASFIGEKIWAGVWIN